MFQHSLLLYLSSSPIHPHTPFSSTATSVVALTTLQFPIPSLSISPKAAIFLLKMSTKGSNKVSQKKGNNKAANACVMQHKSKNKGGENKAVTRSCGFMLCKRSNVSPVRFLKHLGGKVAKGLHVMSMRIRPSPKVSSSSSGTSKPFVTPVDSHRNAAIEDCIEFINSSASLPRSNSVSANPH